MKKKRKYSIGGQLLQTGVSFIPGVGQVLAPLIGMGDQMLDQQKLLEEQRKLQAPPIKINSTPYGSFKKGGVLLNDMFEQYTAGAHGSGNDLTVDGKGQADINGENVVQNKENSFRVDNKQYVFSDTLGGKEKFNIQAMKINKKYPRARFELDQRQALDLEMKLLSKENDVARAESEPQANPKQMAYGGPIPGQALLDASNYWKNNQVVLPDQVPMADPNMFVNPTSPKLYTPEIPQEYQGIEMATDSTQIPGGNAQSLTLGKDLSLPENNASTVNPIAPQLQDRGDGVLSAKGANAIALGLKGAALAGSIYDAFQKPERERLITPNYRQADQYMKSANIDFTQAKQDAVGVSNIGAGTNRSLAGNASQFQGREQARLAQLQDVLGRINMQEENAQSQLDLQKGQYEAGKAVDIANRTYQNQQGNMQNRAATRGFDRQLSSDLSQIGSAFNQYAETTKMNQNNADIAKFTNSQIMATINAKNPNFKLQDNVVENFISGKTSLDDVLAFVPVSSKEEVKKILTEQKLKVK